MIGSSAGQKGGLSIRIERKIEVWERGQRKRLLRILGASGVIRTVEAKRTPFVFQGLSVLEL